MKRNIRFSRLLLISIFLMFSSASYAQDLLIKRNKEEIQVKIIEIEDLKIKYKLFSNVNGPTYSINRAEVFMITYENGSIDAFAGDGSIKSVQPKMVQAAPVVTISPATSVAPPGTQSPQVSAYKPPVSTPLVEEANSWDSRFYLSYTGSAEAPIGLQMGALGNTGFYMGFRISSFGGDFEGISKYNVCNDEGMEDGSIFSDYQFTGYQLTSRGSFTLGITRQLSDIMHVYGGVGYGYKKYWHLYDVYSSSSTTIDQVWANHESWNIEGLEIETGFILELGNFNLQSGFTSVNVSNYNWTFGCGVTF